MSDSDGYPVGTIVVWEVEYAVRFQRRLFRATVGGREVSAYTWDELDAGIKKAARRAKTQVDVPFQTVEGRTGQGVSLHATRRDAVSVVWSDGSRDTLRVAEPYQVEAPIEKLRDLIQQRKVISREIDGFNRQWRLQDDRGIPNTLDQAVRQAIEAKVYEEESES